MARHARTAIVLAAVVAGAGACSRPPEPPTEQPPAPQATELRDAIHAPLDRAKAAGDTVRDAAESQSARIEAEGG